MNIFIILNLTIIFGEFFFFLNLQKILKYNVDPKYVFYLTKHGYYHTRIFICVRYQIKTVINLRIMST